MPVNDVWSMLRTGLWPFATLPRAGTTAEDHDEALRLLRSPKFAQVGPDATPLARFLMDENRRISEVKLATVRALEIKAISQAVAAATVLGLFAAFAPGEHPYKAIPIGLLVLTVVAYILAAYVRMGRLPKSKSTR